MEKEELRYCLYNNKEDKKPLRMAYSKDELKQVSLEYTDGAWYEYDVEVSEAGSTLLWNERPYKGRITFGTEEEVAALKKEKEEIRKRGGGSTGLNSSIILRD